MFRFARVPSFITSSCARYPVSNFRIHPQSHCLITHSSSMSHLPMCCSCVAILSMHSALCISFHYSSAAAHYCETHRIHLIAYTCSFCLCPYHRTHRRHSPQTHLYAMHLHFSLPLSPSLVALFSFFCVSIIFIFLSTSHYLSRPDICRLPITIGSCFYIPHRHLIDSSFLLVSCTLPSRIAPLGRFLRYCVARSSCRVPTRLVESTIIIMFRPAHRLRVTLQCGSPVQRRIRCSVHHFHVIPSPLYSIFRGFARGGTGTRICILPTVDPAVCRCRSKATSLS